LSPGDDARSPPMPSMPPTATITLQVAQLSFGDVVETPVKNSSGGEYCQSFLNLPGPCLIAFSLRSFVLLYRIQALECALFCHQLHSIERLECVKVFDVLVDLKLSFRKHVEHVLSVCYQS